MNAFKSIQLLVLAWSISENTIQASQTFSIEEATQKGWIQVAIKSKGGHLGDVIEMQIKNKTMKELNLKVEAGTILDSKNNDEQDILVTHTQLVYLSANQLKTISINGMCAQAHKGSPTADADYSFGKLADSNLIVLAQVIDKLNYYSNKTAQQAVWTITDTCSIASISGGTQEDILLFKKLVTKITGRSIPNYGVIYKRQNSRDLLGRVIKIEGVFDYNLPENCSPTLAIYDSKGTLVQLIFENIAHQKGKNDLYYSFDTADLPSGHYYARMDIGETLFKEIEIEF